MLLIAIVFYATLDKPFQNDLNHIYTYQGLIPLLFVVADLPFGNFLDDVGIAYVMFESSYKIRLHPSGLVVKAGSSNS